MSQIQLVTGDTERLERRGALGLVCETAPDCALRLRFPDALQFHELFGERGEARRRANELAHALLVDEPAFAGVQQLRVFEETIAARLEQVFLVLNLAGWLKDHAIQMCELPADSWLAEFAGVLAMQCEIVATGSAAGSSANSFAAKLRRVAGRIAQSAVAWDQFGQELRQLADQVDPYHRRAAFARRRGQWREGDIWFYTTAQTFTNTGRAYERYAPRPFTYLVENPYRGGAPLTQAARPWVPLDQFSSAQCAPSRADIEGARLAIETHLRSVELSGADARARDIFIDSHFMREFFARLLGLGLYYARLFNAWVSATRPAALVVGNHVFEAYALLAAQAAGVPTVVIQHGTMGTDSGIVEPPADRYIVRGRFWQNFLPASVRGRSRVLAPPLAREAAVIPGSRQSLLFLTTPHGPQPLWNESELDEILTVLIEQAVAARRELIVRVHPLEDIGAYRGRIEAHVARGGTAPAVTYSQGGSLEPLLARAAVAVTYSSTVFLECLRWQVPIVSFDWHDFGYKDAIRDYDVFHFATSLSELGEMVARGLAGALPPARCDSEPFAAATPEAELARQFEAMLMPASAADAPARAARPGATAARIAAVP